MVAASTVFGVVVALAAIYATAALLPISMVGGAAVGLGWAFYVDRE